MKKTNDQELKKLNCIFDGCDKTFIKKSKLEQHFVKHTTTRKFKCDYLGCKK